MRERLEQVGTMFSAGYHVALEDGDPADLERELQGLPSECRGFAFEGAAMALALLDALTPWRGDRIRQFLGGPGEPHCYMVHVGVGWAWARLPLKNVARARRQLDPMLQWLALDGYGFHEAFFNWPSTIDGKPPPSKLTGYERRAFDQGFGRCLWFVDGGDVELIPCTIAGFGVERQPDLWSGVGLAATYAGGVSLAALRELRRAAGSYQPQLAQGSAFAAKARQRAGNSTEATDLATGVLCEMAAMDAAKITDRALENLPSDSMEPGFELWRKRIQNHFHKEFQLQEK